MARNETPAQIIERLTRRHTVDGYTSYPELCRSLESALSQAHATLATYTGSALIARPGCDLWHTTWGDVPVVVEIDYTDDEAPFPAGVLLNGRWVKLYGCEDVVPFAVQERWAKDYTKQRDDDAAEAHLQQRIDAARAWQEAA